MTVCDCGECHEHGEGCPDIMDLTETCVDSERLFEGKILNLRRDSVQLPDGRVRTREIVEHDPAVVIIAENEKEELLLVRQFRYPIMEAILEFPAGIVERGEVYEDAASRELQEEAGWKPGKMELVAEVFSSPGFTTEMFVVYYATNLEHSKLPEDDDEFILSRFYGRREIEELLADGEFVDAKTLMGVYWWLQRKDAK